MLLPTWQKPEYDDCLWLFRTICLDIFRTKPAKLLLKILLYTIILLNIIQSIMFLKISTKANWIKYLPMYCSSFFILTTIYSTPRMADAFVKGLESLDMWPINAVGSTIEQKIKRETLYLNTFIILNTCLALTSGILFAIPLPDDREIFYTLATIEDYLPQWKNVLCFVYRCVFLILPIIMPAPFYITGYICCHMRFQGTMVLHHLEQVDQELITNITDEKKYNEIIKKRLIVTIQKHSGILRASRKILKDFHTFVYFFSVTGALLLISLIFFLISFEGSFEERYSRIATMVISAVLASIHVIVSGQLIEDMTNRAFDEVLKSLDWSRWNKENKKIFLILLANSVKPFRLKFSESISLNYSLALAILKSIYSIMSVLWYMK
ncbi:hypothetical protein Zmor_008274 [Zophobas morio]|uniref:Odorant receptor n=1 Tax=Zophobas morio TaxID=2755281 RepID=A0AA38MQ57_9CUCU|nr:hypothetical protein Zmor_008274 [Zophobas morio]